MTERDYHVQYIKYVPHTLEIMSCETDKFLALTFFGPHTKPHGVRGFSKHYHLRLYPKLGHGNCEIRDTLCICGMYQHVGQSEDFYNAHHVVIYGIGANIASLVHIGKYGVINS